MTNKNFRALLHSALASSLVFTAGCRRAPSYDVMGSLFPGWLVCIALGVLFAVIGRWLLLRAHIAVVLPVLVYPCLGAVFTFAAWLLFFQ